MGFLDVLLSIELAVTSSIQYAEGQPYMAAGFGIAYIGMSVFNMHSIYREQERLSKEVKSRVRNQDPLSELGLLTIERKNYSS